MSWISLMAKADGRRVLLVTLCLVLLSGSFLRLPPHLFVEAHPILHALQPLHPTPKFMDVGFDEGLYRGYVNDLIRDGITAYPDFAERYVAIQTSLPTAILPPTRFLYVFTAYLWHGLTGADSLTSLRDVSSLFSILLLILATAFAWRLRGPNMGVCVASLMAFAPTQIHMGQHALIDGFFAFWATLCLWLLWENLQHPRNWRWLACYTVALAFLVITKENAMFAYLGVLAILGLNVWLCFGTTTRLLLVTTVMGPLLGVAILVNLCGSVSTTSQIYMLLISKASVLPYAIATGDGPWYRYLVDLMLMSPVILVLALGAVFGLKVTDKASFYLLVFVTGSYLLMANVRYGMNLRYTNMWDMPLRYFATLSLTNLSDKFSSYSRVWLAVFVGVVCLIELRQYLIFFVEHGLYELVTGGLLHAVNILK